jgi:hypothetical protein
MFAQLFRGEKSDLLQKATMLVILIALTDYYVLPDTPLGFLYVIPILVVGSVLNNWQIALAATLCTALSESFDGMNFSFRVGLPRDILYFGTFVFAALYIREVRRREKIAVEHQQLLEQQSTAQEHLEYTKN